VAQSRRLVVAALVSLLCLSTGTAQELRDLFKRVDPAVVEVLTTAAGRDTPSGIGSGFLVSPDGLVITAAHVVQTADRVTVRFLSGESSPATRLAADPRADVALLKVDQVPPGTPVLPLGDSDRVEVGDEVLVIGAPMGMSHTLSVGHVSARRATRALHGGLEPVDLPPAREGQACLLRGRHPLRNGLSPGPDGGARDFPDVPRIQPAGHL